MNEQSLSFILNQLGEERAGYHGAVSPPIHQTTNFAFPTVDDFRQAVKDEKENHVYTRGSNPTIDQLCKKLAALEGAEDALVFASGSAAIATAVIGNLKAGDHVVCGNNVYSWTYKLLHQLLARFDVSTSIVDGTDVTAWEAAIQPNTAMFMLESPNSLLLEMQDIEGLCALAKKHSIITVMDNSYGSVFSTSPMELGVDVTVHSATKFIGGHSDVVAGLVCGTREMIRHLFHQEFMTLGGIMSPHSAWLMLRSLRTLPIRVKQSSENCSKVIEYLQSRAGVEKIHWPFLENHPHKAWVERQMPMAVPMFSLQLATEDVERVEAFCNALNYFLIGASWGGYESLVLPVCGFYESDLPVNLMRMYVGLEEPEELIADLEGAFVAAGF